MLFLSYTFLTDSAVWSAVNSYGCEIEAIELLIDNLFSANVEIARTVSIGFKNTSHHAKV